MLMPIHFLHSLIFIYYIENKPIIIFPINFETQFNVFFFFYFLSDKLCKDYCYFSSKKSVCARDCQTLIYQTINLGYI